MLNSYRHRAAVLILLSVLTLAKVNAQDKITFIAPDKLLVTADLYLVNDTLPYMVLCHDIKSSRGEYKDLAKRFNKLGYNCLAIDMRIGGTKNGVDNETTSLAKAKHITTKLLDSQVDITGAINYAYEKSHKKVILIGSGFSASLVLYIGSTNSKVSSVLAFSPSDYFAGLLDTKTAFPKCPVPVFVASSRAEAAATKTYVSTIPSAKVTLFSPSTDGAHGTDALLNATPDHHDYWLSILMYIRQLQGGN
ncbi:MAG TPA: hypothetical protein VK890_08265 [Bacteroidia bacterium]|jgi:dienelactone hydrolase|nr:hypothetical protein [Bacteroidia bacterium]